MCKVWIGVYVREGWKELGYEVWGGAPESPLSMGPERPCYAHCDQSMDQVLWSTAQVYSGGGGGTQLWVGYGCAARSFDHHPITKPVKTQICDLSKPFVPGICFVNGPFLSQSVAYFLPCNLACMSTFWQPKLKEKFIENYVFCEKATYIYTNFQIKKGPLVNMRGRKSTLSGPHIPVPTFPLSTPPGLFLSLQREDLVKIRGWGGGVSTLVLIINVPVGILTKFSKKLMTLYLRPTGPILGQILNNFQIIFLRVWITLAQSLEKDLS